METALEMQTHTALTKLAPTSGVLMQPNGRVCIISMLSYAREVRGSSTIPIQHVSVASSPHVAFIFRGFNKRREVGRTRARDTAFRWISVAMHDRCMFGLSEQMVPYDSRYMSTIQLTRAHVTGTQRRFSLDSVRGGIGTKRLNLVTAPQPCGPRRACMRRGMAIQRQLNQGLSVRVRVRTLALARTHALENTLSF